MKSHTVYIVYYYQLAHNEPGEVWNRRVKVFEDVNSLAEFIVMLETNRDEYCFTSVYANAGTVSTIYIS